MMPEPATHPVDQSPDNINMQKPLQVPAKLSRIITAVMECIPLVGRIKENRFVTSLGAGMNFHATDTSVGEAKLPAFRLELISGHVWTSWELRDLAAECVEMAKYLDGITPKAAVQQTERQ